MLATGLDSLEAPAIEALDSRSAAGPTDRTHTQRPSANRCFELSGGAQNGVALRHLSVHSGKRLAPGRVGGPVPAPVHRGLLGPPQQAGIFSLRLFSFFFLLF